MDALKKQPMPNEDEAKKMSDGLRQDIAQGHLDMARRMEKRGQFDWSLREYNEILDSVELDSWESAVARLNASRMLGEQLRHQEVVDCSARLSNDWTKTTRCVGRCSVKTLA